MLTTEWIPAEDKGSKRSMVVLHGLGDSLEGYLWLPGALDLPWLNYLLVNAPDDYYGGYAWYDLDNPAPGIGRSRRMLFELLDARRAQGWPTGQTVMFGFSQGCLMTIETGCRYPHTLAGLAGISGYAHEPEQLIRELSPVAREQRFLQTHGTHDPLIPFAAVRAQVEQFQKAGLRIEWHEYAKAHTIAGEAELAVIRKFVKGCFGD